MDHESQLKLCEARFARQQELNEVLFEQLKELTAEVKGLRVEINELRVRQASFLGIIGLVGTAFATLVATAVTKVLG